MSLSINDGVSHHDLPPGSVWHHLKSGKTYTVTGIGLQEATLEPVVLYALEPWQDPHPVTWVRPVEEFLDGRFKRTR